MDTCEAVILAFIIGSIFGAFAFLFVVKTHTSPLSSITDAILSEMVMLEHEELKKKYDKLLNEWNNFKARESLRKRTVKKYQRKQKSSTGNSA